MYRNVLCLLLGLIVGIRLTDFWVYIKLPSCEKASRSTARYPSALGEDDSEKTETTQLSVKLFNETRILCFVLTMPKNHKKKAAKVKATWGRRCNKLLFMSTVADEALGIVRLDVEEGRENLYLKVKASLEYIYERYLDDYDWFLKADDDTYVIMENLRMFLYPYDAEAAVYFGCKFHPYVTQGYMSGGAGYVLSRDALRRYNLFARNNTKFCRANGKSEDKEIGRCLQNVGVVAGDSRDEQGRERFLPFSPRHLMPQMVHSWLDKFLFYMPNRTDCCADTAISFHYTKDQDYFMYEYALYHLKVFGIHSDVTDLRLPKRLTKTEMEEKLHLWGLAKTDNPESP
ncbi:glycoprotein-N-acetylgalactosamine 3-beta-galactosyltransferase 1 [Scaptodrosophila lebanonensis]|uniref:Glycoprotein-N-acetylgalactosamine 3-beta-galactosyltransferase 1 n=1 Tax=Drosophila lebanonensis TaxID=7225 RepID=A0A6J2T5M1_DROLE|nr:glycoprotein-N-acetylgalactosamine 3-beta-galactosyltransferase 1 [Scaptodrosophila lebanonensis]